MALSEERKKLFEEVAREAGLDLLFFFGLPWFKRKLGQAMTPEDHTVIAQARQHVGKGDHTEAAKVLIRHFMGWGLYDEQMFDQDLEAVTRAHLATRDEVNGLAAWLAADQRTRSRFRNSLTLQPTPQARMRVIADYAKMTDAQRLARLTATGKLDDSFDEAVWNWVKTHVPGMTRQAWDGICQGAGFVWGGFNGTVAPNIATAANATGRTVVTAINAAGRGIAAGARTLGNGIATTGVAVRNGAVAADAQCNAWGLVLQANYPPPAPPIDHWYSVGQIVRRLWWAFVNIHR